MEYIVGVPARLNSKRIPEKLLKQINGKSAIMHTLDNIRKVVHISQIFVFADSKKIYDEVTRYGYNCVIVDEECENGTERVAKGVEKLFCLFENVLIIHADQPLIEEENIRTIIEFWKQSKRKSKTMYTLHTKCNIKNDKSIAKIAFNKEGKWLYISRSDIPYNSNLMYKHFGLCMFSKQLLREYLELQIGNLQKIEDNEWLKLLENGYDIISKEISFHNTDLNTYENFNEISRIINSNI